MRLAVLTIAACLFSTTLFAQTPTVTYNYPTVVNAVAVTLAQVNGFIHQLQVNGTPFPLNATCVLTVATPPATNFYTCTAPLPNITSALTPAGTQTFTTTVKDVILEGPLSPPFTLSRPSVTSTPRIQ